MKRLGLALTAVLLGSLVTFAGSASARDIEWCADDPVFDVGGLHFRVTTTIATAGADVADVTYDVAAPAGASVSSHYPLGNGVLKAVVNVTASSDGGTTVTVTVHTTDTSLGAAVTVDLSGGQVSAQEQTGTTNSGIGLTVNAK